MDLTRSESAHPSHSHSLSPALKAERHGDTLSFHIERTAPHCSARLDFENPVFINHLRYECALHVLADIFWSDDGVRFFRIHGLKHESQGEVREFSFPLTHARYIQVHFYQEAGPVHKSDLRKFQMGFVARIKLKASSNFDRLWTVENLIDRRPDYGWASGVHEKNEPDAIDTDLGNLYFIHEVRLKSIADEYNCFPVGFQIQISEDGALWNTVQSEDHFVAAAATWNAWRFAATRGRYVRIQINKHAHYKKGEYQSKILDLAVIGQADFPQEEARATAAQRMASENMPGLTLLAANNIAAPGRVVQSDDVRLRNASTEYRGIIQFARDNEASQEKAVQGNDSRLKSATESTPGIVQLAKNGEDRALAAVQGNDVRLRQGTTETPGILLLAKDGEAKSGLALQANDSRLKTASVDVPGITLLAHDGEVTSGKAVQGNDSRLRVGTQAWPGILQLANHGEIAGAKAVAADDPRLAEADEARKGRVQLARKNESADFKAVQASDPRLQNASEDAKGVVQFARDGISALGQAVQATDSRLADSRTPKTHQHSEYALHEHELNSHAGNLHLKRSVKTAGPDGLSVPADTNIPLLVENSSGLAANLSGGVAMAAEGTAAYVVSKSAPAIQASSRDHAAATLISANAFALHLPRSLPGLKGSEKSIHAEGQAQFDGQVTIKSGACVSVALPRASSEAFADGDLITIENGVASKMRSDNQSFVGVAVKSAGLQLESGTAAIRVAVAGLASLRVYGVVKAGDKLTLNAAQAGTCKVGQGHDKIYAVALEAAASDREKQVLSILIR